MGRHPQKALTAATVRHMKDAGFYADGNGLYLKVDKSGAKRWIQRIVIHGKRTDMGLGSVSLVSLAEARDKAIQNRKVARDGGDPLTTRRQNTAVMTFEQAARQVHADRLPTWSNAKHAQQWINTLKDYVFPRIGRKKMDAITSADILDALSPIWTSKPETASRVKQRIGAVMKWAIAKGWRNDDPTMTISSALPKPDRKVKNRESLTYQDVSEAIETVKQSNASLSAILAFEMLVLTALRPGEVIRGTWDEINTEDGIWTIPACRMKQRKEHRIPLSSRCLEILAEAEAIRTESGYLFPGAISGKPLSENTLSTLMRKLGINCVPHGFRSSFRIWAAEQTNVPREVCEFALAHVVGDAAERAYQRSDLFDKRRQLMEMWAQYIAHSNAVIINLTEHRQ